MTINELEQGLRNLIATQPMVTTGANGAVVSGINSLIDACKNFSYRIQSYPGQDVLKFGIANEVSKIENTLCNLACQVMQERGINLMLYIVPQNQPGYGPMVNSYGVINQQVDPNLMLGQMMYTQPPMAPQTSMMQMPNAMPQMGMAQQMPAYNQMQPTMQGVAPTYREPRVPKSRNAPTFPGYASPDKPVRLEPGVQSEQAMKTRTAPQSKIKSIDKPAPQIVKNNEPAIPVMEASGEPSPAEMLMGGPEPGSGKAKGRDYLMELLKK